MFNSEKIVRGTDAVLNCIPIVNTINNTAQAIYKLAHKVDTLNPVVPGLKTSIKIHILSKGHFDCFIESLPIVGNLIALGNLVLFILNRFDDHLIRAFINNNTEVVHLCLGNNPLNDPNRADTIFGLSAYSSDNKTFRQVLLGYDWSSKNLMRGLRNCRFARDGGVANANEILDYWIAHRKVLDPDDICSATFIIRDFLQKGKIALAQRVIEILPKEVSFDYIKNILLVEKTGVLTEGLRNALIAKSKKPSLQELKLYYISVRRHFIHNTTADNHRKTHLDMLDKLLDLAQLNLEEIEDFIGTTATSAKYDSFVFMEFLVTKYEDLLTPPLKVKILGRLIPCASDRLAFCPKRAKLFAYWIGRWKEDVSPHAGKLYTQISNAGEMLRLVQSPLARRPHYPSIEKRNRVDAQLKAILLEAFPGLKTLPSSEQPSQPHTLWW